MRTRAVAVTRIQRRQLAHPCQHGRILLLPSTNDSATPITYLDQRAGSPRRQPATRRVRYLGWASRHAHQFSLISFITSISMSRSATSFFSRAERQPGPLAPQVNRLLGDGVPLTDHRHRTVTERFIMRLPIIVSCACSCQLDRG
jgi:hypothetical protein